jgi:hypothetical protein
LLSLTVSVQIIVLLPEVPMAAMRQNELLDNTDSVESIDSVFAEPDRRDWKKSSAEA